MADIKNMKKDELLAYADEAGVKVDPQSKKADIIAAIEASGKNPEEKAEEKKPEEKAEVKAEEKKPEEEPEEKAAAEKQMKASTEANRKKKAERREAKAARKEANRKEEKKKRPSNLLIAVLVFGVIFAMFAFIWGYGYYQKEKTVESYLSSTGYLDYYNNVAFDEHSTLKMAAEDNTLKIVLKVNEDVSAEDLKEYTEGDIWEYLEEMGAYMLTSAKPETRAFSADVKIGVKQGDEMVKYEHMTYREAKKFIKEAEKKAEEEAEAEEAADADETAEAEAEAAEESAEAAEEAAEESAEAAEETAEAAEEASEDAADADNAGSAETSETGKSE